MTTQMMPKIRVTVLYFAFVHETTRKKEEIMELSTNTSIKELVINHTNPVSKHKKHKKHENFCQLPHCRFKLQLNSKKQ